MEHGERAYTEAYSGSDEMRKLLHHKILVVFDLQSLPWLLHLQNNRTTYSIPLPKKKGGEQIILTSVLCVTRLRCLAVATKL